MKKDMNDESPIDHSAETPFGVDELGLDKPGGAPAVAGSTSGYLGCQRFTLWGGSVLCRPLRLALILLVGALVGCKPASKPGGASAGGLPDNGRPVIYVVNYPLQYFAGRIASDAVDVVFPAPADVDPAEWMPDRATIRACQSADLILLNGAGYAKWLDKVSLPESRLVDTSAAFKGQLMKIEEVVTHSHGKGGEHSHVGTASHTWLNPRLAVLQAEAIRDALSKRLPDQAAVFAANFEALKRDLMELDAELDAIVKQDRDRPILFSHPIYQYFQQRFAVNSRSLHWEPEEYPGDDEWKKLAELRKGKGVNVLIWEAPPADRTVAQLKGLGVASRVLSPCANVPATGDYLTVMKRNAEALREVYGGTTGSR